MNQPNKDQHQWHFIDLDGKTLGRICTEITLHLMGKEKLGYLPNLDRGDFVVAINAAKIKVTGKKLTDKMYARHSGYPGGLRQYNLGQMLAKDPTQVIRLAVKNMLPKNKLQDVRLARLKVFSGTDSKYADKFKTLNVKS